MVRRIVSLSEGTDKAASPWKRKERLREFRELLQETAYDDSCYRIVDRILEDGTDLRILEELLRDADPLVRIAASWTIGEAARQGVDISPAMDGIRSSLCDRQQEVRLHAMQALDYAQKAGIDVSCAFPELVCGQFDENDDALQYSSAVIWEAALRHRKDAVIYSIGLILRSVMENAASGDESWLIERAVSVFVDSLPLDRKDPLVS